MNTNNNNWTPYFIMKEPTLSFHIEDKFVSESKIDGLFNWGPFDSSISNNPCKPPNPIKIGLIGLKEKETFLTTFLEKLNQHSEVDDLYLKTYKGFREIYGTNLQISAKEMIPNKKFDECKTENEVLDIYTKIISKLKDIGSIDVAIIFIPNEIERWTEIRGENYYFNLHDKIKLNSATFGVRTQIIREKRMPNLSNEKSVLKRLWWLSGALYTKAGGVLYRLAEFSERILYVGLSYAILPLSSSKKILIGVAQLFDEHGNNIRIDLFSTSDFIEYSRNPYLSEIASRTVFEKILDIYRASRMTFPSKVIVHKNTPFNKHEINGIRQATSSIDRLELLHIQKNTPYKALRLFNSKQGHRYPVLRGSVLRLDDYNFLLWTSGSIEVKTSSKNLNYYQEMRHIPSPLLVRRYYGVDTMPEVSTEILKLTKLNFNNLQYYNKFPVTLDFASRIAKISKQAQDFPSDSLPKDFRYYI